ncbi:MAG: prolyl oligopeptidase family serine peptidase [Aureliella sp.]|jgi:dipeptidyl aminopeptidase/acylaminoacyl peptidase
MSTNRFVVFCNLLTLAGLCAAGTLSAAERMTPERLWKLGRIGQAEISPDGRKLAYLVTRYDLAENSGAVDLVCQDLPQWLGEACDEATEVVAALETPLAALNRPKVLQSGVKGLNSLAWIQRPEGLRLLFIAPTKDSSPTNQAWMIDPAGGEPQQVTEVKTGIGNLKAAPTGDKIAFTVDVKLDPTVNDLYKDLPKADARIIDSLMYRHWNAWHDYAYSHVCVAKLDEDGKAGDVVDLMQGLKADCPLPPFGGTEQFAFAPDGKEMALTIKLVNNPAVSTDSSIFLVSTEGGPLKNITPGMPGYDRDPSYSPDGRTIAFSSMQRPGFEADRNRIMLYDRNHSRLSELTAGLDQTAHHATWSADSQSIYFDSETRGTNQVYRIDVEGQHLTELSEGQYDFAVLSAVGEQNYLLVTQQSMLRPVELAVIDLESRDITALTDVNRKVFDDLELPTVEERLVTATDGAEIHNWVILPPDYEADSNRQWPMLTYCQGGPQGQIGQWFSYRWNFHLMASQGYVVLAVNRRGLPGFGQQWNDEISGDWGGQAMQDILAATDAMMADPHIDRAHVAAVGASFGGYTGYWLMGHHEDRFCAIIAHAGVFNLESMYGSTEELFFVNWDLGGPYWKSDQIQAEYDRFSPHRFVGNWKTPLLVIHGEKDFRVPVTQGMEAFTAAQLQGVPSRFLYFPTEDHWVKSPQNSVLWNRVFFDWLDKYCK